MIAAAEVDDKLADDGGALYVESPVEIVNKITRGYRNSGVGSLFSVSI